MALNSPPIQEQTADRLNGRFPQIWIRWLQKLVAATNRPAARSITSISSSYTVINDDDFIDCTSGSFTVTLLTAIGRSGLVSTIRNSGLGIITVEPTLSQTIDTFNEITLSANETADCVSDGSVYKTI